MSADWGDGGGGGGGGDGVDPSSDPSGSFDDLSVASQNAAPGDFVMVVNTATPTSPSSVSYVTNGNTYDSNGNFQDQALTSDTATVLGLFVPAASWVSLGLDAYKTYQAVQACPN